MTQYQKFYQWILKNNQQPHFNNYIITESYYADEDMVRAWCCPEHLYSVVRKLDESEIDLVDTPYLESWCIQSLPDNGDDPWELRKHAEGW